MKKLINSLTVLMASIFIFGSFYYLTKYWYTLKWKLETDIPFDHSKWVSGTEIATTKKGIAPYRHRMINDLLHKYPLIGMPRVKVISLLGEPSNYSDNTKYVSYYYLTHDNGFDIDPVASMTLMITFDKNEIVNSTEVLIWEK